MIDMPVSIEFIRTLIVGRMKAQCIKTPLVNVIYGIVLAKFADIF